MDTTTAPGVSRRTSQSDALPAAFNLSGGGITQPAVSYRPSESSSSQSGHFGPAHDEIQPCLRITSILKGDSAMTSEGRRPRKQKKLLRWHPTVYGKPSPDLEDATCANEAVMIASQISLGILSLPTAVAQVGLIPAVVMMEFVWVICWYTGYCIWQYMMSLTGCSSFADLVAVWSARHLGSPKPGRWVGEVTVNMYLMFLMAAHINVWSDTLYILTGATGTCRIVFACSGAAIILLINLACPLEESTGLSALSSASIIGALLISLTSVGISNPGHGNWHSIIGVGVPGISFAHSSMGVSSIALSFVGHPMYPSIISSMEEPKDFPKALLAFEIVRIVILNLTSCLFYVFGGQDIVSPALGAASPLVAKIAYGTAIPTILMAGAIAADIIAQGFNKHFWEWRGKPERINMAGWSTREEILAQLPVKISFLGLWTFAFIIALLIPVFEELLGLMGALFATSFGFIIPSAFWWDMWKRDELKRTSSKFRTLSMVANAIIPVVGFVVLVLGVYGSGIQINLSAKIASPPFSCKPPESVLRTLARMKGPHK